MMFSTVQPILKSTGLSLAILLGACTFTSELDVPADDAERFLGCLSPGSRGMCASKDKQVSDIDKPVSCPSEFLSIREVMTEYDEARIKVANMDVASLVQAKQAMARTFAEDAKSSSDPLKIFEYGLIAAHSQALGGGAVTFDATVKNNLANFDAFSKSVNTLAVQYQAWAADFEKERELIASRTEARMNLYGGDAFRTAERMVYDLQCNSKNDISKDVDLDLDIGDARGLRDAVREANQVNAFEFHPETFDLQNVSMALSGDTFKIDVLNAWKRIGKFQKAYFKGYFRNGKFIKVNLFYDERRHLRQAYDDLVRRVANLDELPDEVMEEINQYIEGRFDDSERLKKLKKWLERKPEDVVASLAGKLEKSQDNMLEKLKDLVDIKLEDLNEEQRGLILTRVEQVLFTLSKPLREFLKTEVWKEGEGCGLLNEENKQKKVSEIIKECFDFDKVVFDKLKSRLAGLVERFQTRVTEMLERLNVPLNRLDELAEIGEIDEGS